MWSDNDTAEDLIGFRVHAELIRDVVSDDTVLPVTIGVFGDWGSGKTSIMKMLQAELAKDDQVAVVYFDAWLFEGYDDAKSALISSILKQLMENKGFPAELKDKARKLIKRVNWMRLMKMGWDNVALPAVLAYATGGATAVPAVVTGLKALFGKANESSLKSEEAEKLFKESEDAEITEVKDFREKFDELLRDSKFKSLVVLIDDLDRCSPDRIVENLEAIRLFLNVDKTAFIIGADPRIVRHGIAVRYHQALDAARTSPAFGENPAEAAEQLVRDYVEKLIQVRITFPDCHLLKSRPISACFSPSGIYLRMTSSHVSRSAKNSVPQTVSAHSAYLIFSRPWAASRCHQSSRKLCHSRPGLPI